MGNPDQSAAPSASLWAWGGRAEGSDSIVGCWPRRMPVWSNWRVWTCNACRKLTSRALRCW